MINRKVILLLIALALPLYCQNEPDSIKSSSAKILVNNKPHIYHVPLKKLPYNKFSEIECVVEPGSQKLKTVKIFIRDSRERIFKNFQCNTKMEDISLSLFPKWLEQNICITS